MEDLFKYAIEGGSFGVSLFLVFFLSKKFIKKGIIEPIEELKADVREVRKNFIQFTERINGLVFTLMKNNSEMNDHINSNITNMNNLFTDTTRQTSQAMVNSTEALKKVNVMEQTTEKLLSIATKVHEKNQRIETEIKKLSEEFILVKSKLSQK
jgi:methyl-accepting chemotaxis protein